MPSVQSTVRGAVAAVQSVSGAGMLWCLRSTLVLVLVVDCRMGAVPADGGGIQSMDKGRLSTHACNRVQNRHRLFIHDRLKLVVAFNHTNLFFCFLSTWNRFTASLKRGTLLARHV